MQTFQIHYTADGRRYMLLMDAKNEKRALEIIESALKNEFREYEVTRIKKL